jgi:AraC-like DNA-binding protein
MPRGGSKPPFSLHGMAAEYRELAPSAELADHILCGWHLVADDGPTERILPDGSLDLVHMEDGRLIVAGPDTAAATARRRPGSVTVGLRFLPGAAPAVLGVAAEELRDRRVPVEAVWGRHGAELAERLEQAGSLEARLAVLAGAVADRLPDAPAPDRLVAAAVQRLRRDPHALVADVADELALSERQLRRRFHVSVGYGPKMLARVMRLQRLLALAPGHDGLAELALSAGYADQAHMTVECTRLAGLPPAALLSARGLSPA